MHLHTKILLSCLASVAVATFLAFSGAQFLLNKALEREARLAGMDWAILMEDRLADIVAAAPTVSNSASTAVPTTEDLRHLAADFFSIGHMYQIDYINIVCNCHVSLTMLDAQSDAPVPSHTDHDHPSGADDLHEGHAQSNEFLTFEDVSPIPNDLWSHVFQSNAAHDNPQSNQSSTHQFPVDRNLATTIIEQKSRPIFIHHNAGPDLPATFAEVFHPAINGTDVIYLLRVIVDLEDQALFYQRFLFAVVAGSALVLALAIAYPSWHYVDATRSRSKADKRVKFLANHDVLTNLYNRNNFHETASDILWSCKERGQTALLFVFDLNGFKEVNDYHGHPVGDRLLCEFASVLRENTPKDGYIARLGGDEFVVIIGRVTGDDTGFNDFLTMPKSVAVQIQGSHQIASASITGGVARFPRDAETAEELLQLADLALYAAKSEHAAETYEYTPEIKEKFFDRLKVRDEFRNALAASQIEPYYQPIINIKTGAVDSLEALARWNHPKQGILTPFVFSEALNDNDICAQLGQVMFRNVLDDMASWLATGVPFNKVGVNVTDGDLKPASFADDILRALEARKLHPSSLAIEVTENCLFGPEKANSLIHLRTLRDAGCSIALDDFGTGYSSITQLKELPITRIKIDKSFIDDVLENKDDQSIISAMLDLGRSMDFDLVMEGIETAQQLSLLTWMGSELAQGYYYSHPIPAAKVPAFIERQNSSYDHDELHSTVARLRASPAS